MRTNYFAAILTLVLLATACGAGSGDGGGNGDPTSGGTLVTGGSRFVQTRDLSAGGGWETLLEYNLGNGLPAVHSESSTLYMARFTMADPFRVEVHDLDPFDPGFHRSFVWPETALADEVLGMAVSPVGHVAGVLEDVGGTYLQVLRAGAEEGTPLLTGFDDVTGKDLVWRNDTTLLFPMDLGHVTEPEVDGLGGAIVAIDLTNLLDGGPEGEVPLSIVVGFDADAWNGVDGVHGVRDLALAPEGDQLAFTFGGDVWLQDLRDPTADPRQLTTGPFPHIGAAFSPDGTGLALVEYVESRTSSVHLIPVTLSEPVLLDSDRPEGRRHYLDGVVAGRILAWLP